MAYVSQEMKKAIAEKVKAVLPKGWKVSFRVTHHSTLTMTVKEMPKADFLAMTHKAERRRVISDCLLNHSYSIDNVFFDDFEGNEFSKSCYIVARKTGVAYDADFLSPAFAMGRYAPYNPQTEEQEAMRNKLIEIVEALACQNYDNSESYYDYFDTGYYMEIDFGSDKKPCKLV